MTNKTPSVSLNVGSVQVDIFDLTSETEYMRGSVPAGAEDAEAAKQLFYRALVENTGWRDQLRSAFRKTLVAWGEDSSAENDTLLDELVHHVGLVLIAAQQAEAVRPKATALPKPK